MKKPIPLRLGIIAATLAAASWTAQAADRVPITTTSAEAKKLYLEARDLNEKLRFTDARERYRAAAAADPEFALAHWGVALTSATAAEFFASLDRAVALSGKASPAERMMILGSDAGAKSRADEQKKNYTDLVALYPDDERALTLLANYHFGTQDYQAAIDLYERAKTANAGFAPLYNQLGYAYRFLQQYQKAEEAFRKYVELIPNEPNPYDSYAEFLMKTGRFSESIRSYEKALEVDPHFVASYVGICNNQIFLGKGNEARAACDRLSSVARTAGERRQALLWKAVSFVHEGATDDAVNTVRAMSAISEKDNDLSTIGGDQMLIGNILLEAGRLDEAMASFRMGLETTGRADVPPEVKEATRRAFVYQEGRMAAAGGDLAAARAKTEEYRKLATERGVPFELRQIHELAGRVAILEKKYDVALRELKDASQQNPEILYLEAVACEGAGDMTGARSFATSAAEFNALNVNYAYVRGPARQILARL